jgi:hypothetical protein
VQPQEQQPKAGESSLGQAIQKGEAVEGSPSVSRTAAMSSLPQFGQGCPGPFTAPTVAPHLQRGSAAESVATSMPVHRARRHGVLSGGRAGEGPPPGARRRGRVERRLSPAYFSRAVPSGLPSAVSSEWSARIELVPDEELPAHQAAYEEARRRYERSRAAVRETVPQAGREPRRPSGSPPGLSADLVRRRRSPRGEPVLASARG